MIRTNIYLKLILCTILMLATIVSVHADQLRYQLDSHQSYIRVKVYRDGAMKWFGHNHVISHSNIRGEVLRDILAIENSRFTLIVPVEEFVVDDDHDRQMSGSAFSTPIDVEDALATRNNMFRREVLDIANFPKIGIQGSIAQVAEQAVVHFQITIKGVSRGYTLPISIRYSDARITARGDFTIKQSDFEIIPFSLMGGMLAVKDAINISFVIVARR